MINKLFMCKFSENAKRVLDSKNSKNILLHNNSSKSYALNLPSYVFDPSLNFELRFSLSIVNDPFSAFFRIKIDPSLLGGSRVLMRLLALVTVPFWRSHSPKHPVTAPSNPTRNIS